MSDELRTTRARFHTLIVERSVDLSLTDPLNHFLSDFEWKAHAESPQLRYTLQKSVTCLSRPGPEYRPSFYQDHIQAYIGPDGFAFWDGFSRVDLDTNRRFIFGRLTDETMDDCYGREMLFDLVFASSLRMFGIFQVHAAAVVRNGQCILIAGPSGSGKTTAALAFALAGWSYMTDERAFLKVGDQGIDVFSLREAARVRRATADAYSSSLGVSRCSAPDALGKVHLDLEAHGLKHQDAARSPRHLVFPSVTASSKTSVSAISKAEAFGKLLLSSSLLAIPGSISRPQHLEALRQVVNSGWGWEVKFGRDLLDEPRTTIETLFEVIEP